MIFLFGNGKLGSEIQKTFSKEELKVFTKKDVNFENSELKTFEDLFKKYKPNCVINTAAITDVDLCEEERFQAIKVNVEVPAQLAVLCNKFNAKFIHISSDYVFNGKSKDPYIEYDFPNPINYYGYSKWLSERAIKNSGCKFALIRTGELFNNEKGIVPSIFNKLKEGKIVSAISDQEFSPTNVKNLADQLYIIYKNNLNGTFHATSEGSVSAYELILFLAESIGKENLVQKSSKFEFHRIAVRPSMCVLENLNLKALGINIMKHWEEVVSEFLKAKK